MLSQKKYFFILFIFCIFLVILLNYNDKLIINDQINTSFLCNNKDNNNKQVQNTNKNQDNNLKNNQNNLNKNQDNNLKNNQNLNKNQDNNVKNNQNLNKIQDNNNNQINKDTTENFLFTINEGFEFMKKKKVAFSGLLREAESYVKKATGFLEKIGKLFQDYRILLYENDSSDNTKKILAELRKNNSKIIYVSVKKSLNN